MKTTSVRAKALACALLAGTALCAIAAPASAQTPREHRALDSNGVDLTHGDFVMAFVEGSIGSGEAELALVRSRIGSGNGSAHVSSGGHQWDGIYLTRTVGSSGTIVSVVKDNRNELFGSGASPTGSSVNQAGNGEHHYRSADGTLVVFGDPSGSTESTSTYCNGSPGQGGCTQLPLSIAAPDGKSVTFEWKTWQSCPREVIGAETPANCSYWARIQSVSNSFGYRIAFTYATDGEVGLNGAPPPNSWQRRTRARLFNDPVSTTAAQAEILYEYPSAGAVEVTDAKARKWLFSSAGAGITGIRRPGMSSDTTSIAYGGLGSTVSTVIREGVTTSYSRTVAGTTATMTVTQVDPSNPDPDPVTEIVSDLTIGRPTSVKDPLGRTTRFSYDNGRLERTTAPEGNYVEHSYDVRGNVIKTVAVPKGGAGPVILTSASFDSTCSNPLTCNRPNSTTDARGNVTDYTYDPNHGGVLTVTAPAPTPNAVRPQTRFGYTPVNGEYRLTSVSQCRTTASCSDGTDEVKTEYAYDPNGNLYWTATRNGTATLVAETTMTFNALGDPVAIDGPLPGSSDTSRIRYEAREPVWAIGPDPDGPAGPLKHRAVRNTYNSVTGLLDKVEQGVVADPLAPAWDSSSPVQAAETLYDGNARPVVSKLTSGSTVHAIGQTHYDGLGRPDCSAQRMNMAAFATVVSTISACNLGPRQTGT
ncbi:MAG TPA: hypothetical protein VF548_01190, partial [Allosphingosinicella sp.]